MNIFHVLVDHVSIFFSEISAQLFICDWFSVVEFQVIITCSSDLYAANTCLMYCFKVYFPCIPKHVSSCDFFKGRRGTRRRKWPHFNCSHGEMYFMAPTQSQDPKSVHTYFTHSRWRKYLLVYLVKPLSKQQFFVSFSFSTYLHKAI